MKKIIFSVILLFSLFFLSSESLAQTNVDCWGEFSDITTKCLKANTQCNINCSNTSGGNQEKIKSCLNSCSSTHGACNNQATATYNTCIAIQKQPETKQSKPTELPVPTLFKSSTDYILECWNKQVDGHAVCGKASTQCLIKCSSVDSNGRDACMRQCSDISDACRKPVLAEYDVCIETGKKANKQKGQNIPDISTEKSSVGISSNDFKTLAQANAQYQKAQADLEKIKESNDSNFEAKKDFSIEYNAAFKGDENLKKDLEVLRADIETVHELVSKYKDFSEIEETAESIRKGKIGNYGKLNLFTDTVKSLTEYQDLRAQGVSAKDARTKATLDNYGSSVLTIIPVLGAIDLVATTPDFILGIFGIDKNNWLRKYVTEGVMGKLAPSGVVKQTTNLMIEDDWSDIGNALKFGWNKMVSAESVGDKVWESGKLLAGTIGAVPVAIARGISDVVGGGVDFISSWFTYPN